MVKSKRWAIAGYSIGCLLLSLAPVGGPEGATKVDPGPVPSADLEVTDRIADLLDFRLTATTRRFRKGEPLTVDVSLRNLTANLVFIIPWRTGVHGTFPFAVNRIDGRGVKHEMKKKYFDGASARREIFLRPDRDDQDDHHTDVYHGSLALDEFFDMSEAGTYEIQSNFFADMFINELPIDESSLPKVERRVSSNVIRVEVAD